uniref:T2SS protein K first SAM-like domain-containing protein n=1 Tax=Caulobacter sp. (strain K31) TaxID=366602 RepID=B0T7N9_CAUSK
MSAARTGRRGEDGFALVPALIGVLLFAYIAYAVLAADLGVQAGLDAQVRTARLEAAADAALATAIHGLAAEDVARRWSLDGRPHRLEVAGVEAVAVVEDERGKIPLNRMDEESFRRLFEAAGARGARLDHLVNGATDWRTGGGRIAGGSLAYAQKGVRARGGPFRTVGELMEIDGMSADLLARISPAVTLFFGETGGFVAGNAHPLALAVMTAQGADSPDAIARNRALAGQRTAVEVASAQSYVGRPLTIRVLVRDGRGGVFRRATVIEFTGRRADPVWVRAAE